jgi:hypothetical protein
MAKQRRSFSTQFKLEAAQLVTEQGCSISQARGSDRKARMGENDFKKGYGSLNHRTDAT